MTGLQDKEALNVLTKQWLLHLTQAGFSYSRIAERIQLSTSGVRQLLRFPQRVPREQSARQLAVFFLKVFSEPPRKSVMQYTNDHSLEICLLVKLTKHYI